MKYTNLDGVEVQVTEDTQRWIDTWVTGKWGYTRIVHIRGTVGYTELGMWTRNTQRVGIVAWLRPDSDRFAYALLDNGKILEGCWCLFGDGTFSLS